MSRNPKSLRREAATLERFAAESMVRADKLKKEARRLEQDTGSEDPAELVRLWFAFKRRVVALH